MDWLDEEFFELGAYEADLKSGKVLLGKGGHVQEASTFDRQELPQFVLKDFFKNRYQVYTPRTTLWVSLDELRAFKPAKNASFISTGTKDHLYTKDFEKLSRSFGMSLEKVVLISREEFKANHFTSGKMHLFTRSLSFGTGTPYGFWNQDYGIVGSTPEILYTLRGETLETHALAGTSTKGQEEELLQSEKNRHEHQLVVQDIEEKLQDLTQDLTVGPTGIANFKHIIHLKTPVEARLRPEVSLSQLTERLSPTAALGGYPHRAALNFLEQTTYQETHGERYFGSAFGVIAPELTQFVVMIRNVQWKDKNFIIESGGGVVPASILSQELEEINLKRSVIRSHYL